MKPQTGPPKEQARQVIATGPEWGSDKNGKRTQIWQVWAADEGRNPVSRVYKCYGYWKAYLLAMHMAGDKNVPIVNECKNDPRPDPARTARRAYLLSILGKGMTA